MNDLVMSELTCRRQTTLFESSVFKVQSLFFIATIGLHIGNEKMNHYVKFMEFLWNSSMILHLYNYYLNKKESLIKDFYLRLNVAMEGPKMEFWDGSLSANRVLVHDKKIDREEKVKQTMGIRTKLVVRNIQPHWENLCRSLFLEYLTSHLQLFSTYNVEHARMQKELLLALHYQKCMEGYYSFSKLLFDDSKFNLIEAPEEIYGLVVSDGRLLNRSGHLVKEHYYQVRVIQSFSPAFPLVQAGDVLLSINGRSVVTLEGAREELRGHPKTLRLLLLRQQRVVSVTVRV
ncbi:uncharacterized protein TM35_000071260 [Trypanosoma theileri]|uniref:PDZ domain-containing protein n=1 Tax=Trypanosoma theileri TaxID=67003 RepID=A0A1X0P1A7_9TRYP|nr:uncharacterized protein TM35_000071260 [Trypanosoma theileri]ORC90702.1 hypothetical protein TM35_000071260 [Trypanosoma theileri]